MKKPKLDPIIAITAPGIVGELSRWMTSCAIRPQPILSLGAALALVGALKGHRVATETNLRTNLLLAGIAPSGTGKNNALECIKRLLEALKLESLLGGEPASDAGLIRLLTENRGLRLVLWDEFGQALRQIAGQGAQGFQKEILVLMTKLFSCAGSSHIGKSFSEGNYAHKSAQVLKQPHLCVWACSTPERLYSSLHSNLVEDGFLARFLFLECESSSAPPVERTTWDVPPSIVAKTQEIITLTTNVNPGLGNLEKYTIIKPHVIPTREDAIDTREDIRLYFDSMTREAEEKGDLLRSLWSRGFEHTMKVALTVNDNLDGISKECLAWSFALVDYCLSALAYQVDASVADSKVERDTKRCLRIIKESPQGTMTKAEFCRKTQWLTARERKAVVEQLVQNNSVALQELKLNQSQKKSVVLRAF